MANWGRTGLTKADDGNVEIDLVGAYTTFTAEIQNEIETIIRRLGREMQAELEEKSPDGEFLEKKYKGKRYRYSRRKYGASPGSYKHGWKVKFSDRKKGHGRKDSSHGIPEGRGLQACSSSGVRAQNAQWRNVWGKSHSFADTGKIQAEGL